MENLEVPELKDGQVLVRIAYSGICRSQLNEIYGLRGKDNFLPHTLGHEGSGTVEAVGAGVRKVRPGDHVVLTWIKGIGLEAPSSEYKNSDGVSVNSGAISTFLSKAVISENRLVKIPNGFPLKEAALLGCAVPTGAGIVINTANVSSAKTVAIFGMGGVGYSALFAANVKGALTIIAVDISEARLKHAISLGASHTLNAHRDNVVECIMDITGGRGVDYAIESAGKRETMEMAFKSICYKGGLCIIAGNLSYGETINIDPLDLIKGKRIIGTWGGDTNPDADIPMYAELALSGKLDLKKMICRVYKMEHINEAIEYMQKDALGRVLIDMDGHQEAR